LVEDVGCNDSAMRRMKTKECEEDIPLKMVAFCLNAVVMVSTESYLTMVMVDGIMAKQIVVAVAALIWKTEA
jgi:hypothetical protein